MGDTPRKMPWRCGLCVVVPIAILLAASLGQIPAGLARPEGQGIAVGDKSRLHLSMDLGTGYDSNPNMVSDGGLGAAFLLLRPRFKLHTPARTYYLDASGDVRFRAYPGLDSGGGDGDELILFDGDIVLDFGPMERNRQIELDCVNTLGRTVNPGLAVPGSRVGFTHNHTEAAVTWRPATRALSASLRYDLRFRWYDSPTYHGWLEKVKLHISDNSLINPHHFNNVQHTMGLTGILLLLRDLKVHATLHGSQLSYLDAVSPHPAQASFGVKLGFVGPLPLTAQLSAQAELGAAVHTATTPSPLGGSASRESAGNVDGAAEVTYALDAYDRVALGLRHTAEPVVAYKDFSSDDAYLRSEHRLLRRFVARAQISYSHRTYAGSVSSQAPNRAERHVETRVQLGVPLGDRLGVGVTVLYEHNQAARAAAGPSVGTGADTSFRRFFLLLSLSAVR